MNIAIIGKSLQDHFDKLGLTQIAIAKKLGVSKAYVNSLFTGKRPFGKKQAEIWESEFGISRSFLLTGEGPFLKSNSNAHEIGSVIAIGGTDDIVTLVDYIPVAAHATFIENLITPTTNQFEKFPVILHSDEREEADKYKIFEVDGDSMAPSIYDGAIVLAKEIPESRWHYAEGTVIISFAEYVVIKRIKTNRLLTDNLLILSSDNQKYGQMTVQLSDIRAIYKAKRIISSDIK